VRAYSMDLRERVVAAVDAGMTQPQAAAGFGVSLRTVERYLGRRRSTGSLAATAQRHGPEPKTQQLHAWLPARLDAAADATLAEHVAAFVAAGGEPVAGVDVAGDRQPAGRTPRPGADPERAGAAAGPAAEAKSLSATERDEDARAAWRERMATIDPGRLVFVDECGTRTALTRRRARAVRGERAHGAVPRHRGPVTTLFAGVSLGGMRPAMTVEGGTDTAVFAGYLERVLLPALALGMVVVVDNVGAHQTDRIRALVAAAGCELVFLPAYSPDLSPLEEAFSNLKALIRAAGARTRAALDAAIAAALDAITPADAAGWFTHAGY
jgi:transposase